MHRGIEKVVATKDSPMTLQNLEQAVAVKTLRTTVEGQMPQEMLAVRHSVQVSPNVRKAWRRTEVANYLRHRRSNVLQMDEAGRRRRPPGPIHAVEGVATEGAGPRKRMMNTQEPIRDVFTLCGARVHQDRAPRGNMDSFSIRFRRQTKARVRERCRRHWQTLRSIEKTPS